MALIIEAMHFDVSCLVSPITTIGTKRSSVVHRRKISKTARAMTLAFNDIDISGF
jgi:hypothetical protein